MQELNSFLNLGQERMVLMNRHRGREWKSECTLCGAECESMVKLEELLGDRYADFEALNSVEKMSYGLRREFWKQNLNLYLA